MPNPIVSISPVDDANACLLPVQPGPEKTCAVAVACEDASDAAVVDFTWELQFKPAGAATWHGIPEEEGGTATRTGPGLVEFSPTHLCEYRVAVTALGTGGAAVFVTTN